MIKIRNYSPKDYESVKQILQEADLFDKVWDSEENLSGMISKNPQSILVAEENGKIVANVFLISYGLQVSWIFRLAVKKEYRKHGIASELIKFAEKVLRKKGALEIGLFVDSKNEELLSFYKKRSFKTSENPLTYIYLWKELPKP